MPRPTARPAFLEEPPSPGGAGVPYPRITLELRTITPVVGGGVTPFEPDEVDGVRVPGIRGHLRWWWRQLYSRKGESADALFRREAQLWGGVDVDQGSGGGGPGLRSLVQVQVEVIDPGQVVAAGEHPARPGQAPGAAARWADGDDLGYGLFPLQKQEEERRAAARGLPLPTKSIRKDLRFRLILTWRAARHGSVAEKEVEQVLAPLWAWVHLGGIGARTRRGFGAFDLVKALGLERLPSAVAARWPSLFDPSTQTNLEERLGELDALAAPANPEWPPSLLVGSGKSSALVALRTLLSVMKEFRQGANVGRDPGTHFPVGRSRWPEPNLLRLLVDPSANWEHPIPGGLAEHLEDMGVPRAAFGLPIEAKFKRSDRRSLSPGTVADEEGNARILPVGDERWASPVLLRPVRDGESYRPLVAILRGDRPKKVRLVSNGAERAVVAVESAVGSRAVIANYLGPAKGDALAAFVAWLKAERQFQELDPRSGKGGTHA